MTILYLLGFCCLSADWNRNWAGPDTASPTKVDRNQPQVQSTLPGYLLGGEQACHGRRLWGRNHPDLDSSFGADSWLPRFSCDRSGFGVVSRELPERPSPTNGRSGLMSLPRRCGRRSGCWLEGCLVSRRPHSAGPMCPSLLKSSLSMRSPAWASSSLLINRSPFRSRATMRGEIGGRDGCGRGPNRKDHNARSRARSEI
jgi:hypothetical protein